MLMTSNKFADVRNIFTTVATGLVRIFFVQISMTMRYELVFKGFGKRQKYQAKV